MVVLIPQKGFIMDDNTQTEMNFDNGYNNFDQEREKPTGFNTNDFDSTKTLGGNLQLMSDSFYGGWEWDRK